MNVLKTAGWQDYELLDSGNGRRLERFGKYVLSRPDPQAVWEVGSPDLWKSADAEFTNDKWIMKNTPASWQISYKDLLFYVRPTPFKHTGVFPEQHLNWDFIADKTREDSNVLNLFGYTGIASLIAAKAGAKVTHVDASKSAITWTRENQELSKLADKPIRWILDDALSFVQREIKRGVKYDGIIMDPPAYGHGPKGEVWDFNKDLPKLLNACKQVLSDKPLFFIINAYAVSASSLMLNNLLEDTMKSFGGSIEYGELVLEEKKRKRLLSTGIFARWSV